MKHSYLSAVGLLLCCACSKDNDTPALSLPGKYQANNSIVATAINMYTSTGQVNNATLIDNFIRRSRVDSYFSRTDVTIPAGSSLELSINSDNKATFVSSAPNDPRSPDSLKTEILSRAQDHLVLAEFDSITVPTYSASNRCEELSQRMVQVQPNKRCYPIAFVSGYSQQCRYRRTSALLIKDGNLRLPLFSWLIKVQQGGNVCGNAYSNVRNLFDVSLLNQLKAGDTIVVQVREIPFRKL